MQRLSFKDNIRACAVCKTWREACVSVRVDEYPTPWLISYTLDKEEYELYDPLLDKTYIRKSTSPDLRDPFIECSTDGWLLMHDNNFIETFFFNPFTHERIGLPWPDMWNTQALAFSSAPTSNGCVIFSVFHVTKRSVIIKTYCLDTKECTAFMFPHRLPLKDGGFEHVVFSNGVFYCLASIGWLGMFDLSTTSWNVLSRRAPKCVSPNDRFMTEYQGDIFLIYTNTHDLDDQPRYLKLDLANQKWTDKIRLGGLAFYLSSKSSLTANRDLLYNQQMHQRCICSYVWVKPPLNVSDLFKS
ncbi:F-box protein At3g56470 [Eutrema salsugineum]|nr:F-box protein At3g56470 [Eutrema salsugineum]